MICFGLTRIKGFLGYLLFLIIIFIRFLHTVHLNIAIIASQFHSTSLLFRIVVLPRPTISILNDLVVLNFCALGRLAASKQAIGKGMGDILVAFDECLNSSDLASHVIFSDSSCPLPYLVLLLRALECRTIYKFGLTVLPVNLID